MKQRGKKSLKITDAIVRGGKNAYEFEVFPIETEFEPQSAVYIFSHRKTDKKGRGHQKFFCVGQTDSLDGEFAKHKKQFAAKYKANVICVRIEEEKDLRLKIEEELKSAYNISCSSNIEKAVIKTEKPKAVRQISKTPEPVEAKKKVSAEKFVVKKSTKPAPEKAFKAAESKEKAASKKTFVKAKDPKIKSSKAQRLLASAKPKIAKQKTIISAENSKVAKQKIKAAGAKPGGVKQSAKLSPVKPKAAKQKIKSPATKPKTAEQNIKNPAIKPKAAKRKIKYAASQPAKISVRKNKPEAKKQKAAAQKIKAVKTSKTSKVLKTQKVLDAKKIKSNGNGKPQPKQKIAVKQATVKRKKRPVERGSRKQLAF